MSSDNVILELIGVNKKFRKVNSVGQRLKQLINYALYKKDNFDEKNVFYALRDISFNIKKGETVGIVGTNGSGKSTVLQIICGTLEKTSGNLSVKGRIAALLELGSGFNPNFTGRENVYMNASILGMSKSEIDEKFESIVSFSELGDFIDQPVNTYSSGMLVRLAFAVAISVSPEILVIDEALAVGDELFQRKCYSRINQLKKNGATVLFVSHDAKAVVELCDRAILIDKGELLGAGRPKLIVGLYQKLIYSPISDRHIVRKEIKENLNNFNFEFDLLSDSKGRELDNFDPDLKPITTIVYPTFGAEISNLRLSDENEKTVNILTSRFRYKYKFDITFFKSMKNVRFSMVIKTSTGFSLGGYFTHDIKDSIEYVDVGEKITACFYFDCLLATGTYFLNAGAYFQEEEEEMVAHRIVDGLVFRVAPKVNDLTTEIVNFNFDSDVI